MQYWPAAKEKSELYGDIEVRILHEEELANFHIRTIRLIKVNEQVNICWPVKTSADLYSST